MSALLPLCLLGQFAAGTTALNEHAVHGAGVAAAAVPPAKAASSSPTRTAEPASLETPPPSAHVDDDSGAVRFAWGLDLGARYMAIGSVPIVAGEIGHHVGVQGRHFHGFGLFGGALGVTEQRLRTQYFYAGVGGMGRFGRFHVGGIQRLGALSIERVSNSGSWVRTPTVGVEALVGVDLVDLGSRRTIYLDGGLGADSLDLSWLNPAMLSATIRAGVCL